MFKINTQFSIFCQAWIKSIMLKIIVITLILKMEYTFKLFFLTEECVLTRPIHENSNKSDFDCLFDLLFYVPVNSCGHVGTFPPFYGTFTQHWGCYVTIKMCIEFNHPSEVSVCLLEHVHLLV